MRDDLKRVKKKLSLTFAIAIIGTCVVFGILYDLGIDLLNNYIEGTTLIYDNEKPYIDEFQQYVISVRTIYIRVVYQRKWLHT